MKTKSELRDWINVIDLDLERGHKDKAIQRLEFMWDLARNEALREAAEVVDSPVRLVAGVSTETQRNIVLAILSLISTKETK